MDFRIGHLAYRTRDMEKTLAFYTGALGFQHIFSLANERGEKWIEYVMTPDGRFLVCCNERSNRVTAFALSEGRLEQIDALELTAPTNVIFRRTEE